LTWRLVHRDAGVSALRIDNPTPYHVTLARIVLGSDALDLRGAMVPPFGRVDLALDGATFDGSRPQPAQRGQALRAQLKFEFLFVNDSGGTERRTATRMPENDS
jgi:P pilus assembly chaperone PapD